MTIFPVRQTTRLYRDTLTEEFMDIEICLRRLYVPRGAWIGSIIEEVEVACAFTGVACTNILTSQFLEEIHVVVCECV